MTWGVILLRNTVRNVYKKCLTIFVFLPHVHTHSYHAAGSDYSPLFIQLSLSPGDTDICQGFIIIDDSEEEITEYFFINLDSSEVIVSPERQQITINIVDNGL